MPNVRGAKRRTTVMSDDLWDDMLGNYAEERSTSRGAILRGLERTLDLKRPHVCGEGCRCPHCGSPLLWWLGGRQHACSKPDCPYANGGIPDDMERKILAPDLPH
jgi:hypothetical protein